MSTGGAVVIIGGLGLAVFLYLRSQQAQAAAIAAAQAAPGPGVLTKLGNTAKELGGPLATTATGPVRGILGGISSVFGGGGGPPVTSTIDKFLHRKAA